MSGIDSVIGNLQPSRHMKNLDLNLAILSYDDSVLDPCQ